ncbi:hypothetical protein A3G55_04220 [Candidatus Giovannonibacteria bacterium RIFCSPLOWO2_12_FULL_44_25]|uniref:Uncharacterized protein n=3 Tax=Parcubacteria group TaxID=1794811 RepID=A0A837IQX1_9BACT|nr:MAG: hypothetical protein UW15_C0002G0013 [Parcubacteria group bacterium GW2011_GWC1_44_10]KKT59928.1 MAG: hypothetical protein UW53_C0005G0011 [Candidatus Giovannonibacteria bacterium GW2011_GWA1_44_25]KKU12928.1 MAG: hypothetical protein UX18_C0006G0012 [Candidatus Azambacteria bacterium GW2011_GWC2_45_7b]KKU29757.1 MAG: hypothetical protein UX43_C0006G0032 [Candidatus Giovannonibacteria bacterium GW2011_GWB1_46_20]OGF49138.1 MAG: hypothetical protein A2120_01600 [Candidatus Giovannonibact
MKDLIKKVIEREMERRLDIDSYLRNTQEILRALPEALAEAIVTECFENSGNHGKLCACGKCLLKAVDEGQIVDLHS